VYVGFVSGVDDCNRSAESRSQGFARLPCRRREPIHGSLMAGSSSTNHADGSSLSKRNRRGRREQRERRLAHYRAHGPLASSLARMTRFTPREARCDGSVTQRLDAASPLLLSALSAPPRPLRFLPNDASPSRSNYRDGAADDRIGHRAVIGDTRQICQIAPDSPLTERLLNRHGP
jgi:hypothetical protein